jgi:hypothetical protein
MSIKWQAKHWDNILSKAISLKKLLIQNIQKCFKLNNKMTDKIVLGFGIATLLNIVTITYKTQKYWQYDSNIVSGHLPK